MQHRSNSWSKPKGSSTACRSARAARSRSTPTDLLGGAQARAHVWRAQRPRAEERPPAIRERRRPLLEIMKDVADGRLDAGEDTLAAFALESNSLLRKVDLKPITLSPPPMSGDSPSGEEGAEFSFAEESPAAKSRRYPQGASGDLPRGSPRARRRAPGSASAPRRPDQRGQRRPRRAHLSHAQGRGRDGRPEGSQQDCREPPEAHGGGPRNRGTDVDDQFLKNLLGDTRRLLKLANLPSLHVASPQGARVGRRAAERGR